MGVIEQTAPGRSALVARRAEAAGRARGATDTISTCTRCWTSSTRAAWNAEAGRAAGGEAGRELAPALAEGALMRLECGAACFRRYRQELGVPA